uniref:Uncharacterized protein n=1 Tax=Anguilla anguilla TaxID=7936 RepID=A0A0E9TZ04_ANGAN
MTPPTSSLTQTPTHIFSGMPCAATL